MRVTSAQLLHKIMNVKIAGLAGMVELKTWSMVNTKMWHHPKYYKELAKKRKELERQQAASVKPQAVQDASSKHQAASGKVQASSRKRQAP